MVLSNICERNVQVAIKFTTSADYNGGWMHHLDRILYLELARKRCISDRIANLVRIERFKAAIYQD